MNEFVSYSMEMVCISVTKLINKKIQIIVFKVYLSINHKSTHIQLTSVFNPVNFEQLQTI
jgi:hypothetical protein